MTGGPARHVVARRTRARPGVRPAWLTDLPVLLVAVVWGASYLAAKGITTAHTVIAVLVLRFAVVLPALAVAAGRRLRALTAAQWRGGALLGLVLGGVFPLETYGLVHTSATNAGLIISLTMVLTPLGEAALTRTRPSGAFLARGRAVRGRGRAAHAERRLHHPFGRATC